MAQRRSNKFVSNVSFANNVSREDGSSILIQNSKWSKIVDNELRPSLRSGIGVGGSNEDPEIARNVVTTRINGIASNGPTGAIDRFTGPTTNTMVTENTTTDQRGNAAILAVSGAGLQDSHLLNNTASGNTVGNGILLQRATNNELLGNTAYGNTLDGIQLQAGSIDNEVRGKHRR